MLLCNSCGVQLDSTDVQMNRKLKGRNAVLVFVSSCLERRATNMYLRYAGTLDIFAKALEGSEARKKKKHIKAHTNRQGERKDRKTVGKTEQKTELALNELHNTLSLTRTYS